MIRKTVTLSGQSFRPNAKGYNAILDLNKPQDTPNNSIFINRGLFRFAFENLVGKQVFDTSTIGYNEACQGGATVTYQEVKAGDKFINGEGNYTKDALIATSVQLHMDTVKAFQLILMAGQVNATSQPQVVVTQQSQPTTEQIASQTPVTDTLPS